MMGNLESARIAPQKQVGQQAAKPYSAMFSAIEYYESHRPKDGFTREQIREAVIEALMTTYSRALAERKADEVEAILAPKLKTPAVQQVERMNAPFTEDELHSINHCGCVYCCANLSKILTARLAAVRKAVSDE
jgi:hypothetical protein